MKNKKPPRAYNKTRDAHLKDADIAIAAFNKATTGHESHIEFYYDDNGNIRRRFVPNALFMEKAYRVLPSCKIGGVRILKVSEDGKSHIPMHDENNPILFSCIKPTIQILSSYAFPQPSK